jgi:sulfite exporter TauE/SafE
MLDGAAFVAVLAGAFLASPHCVLMCGPLRLLGGNRLAYQAGRGLAYSFLGLAAGTFGWSLPPWALAVFALLAIAGIALQISLPRPKWHATNPFFLGLSSGLLPCGLLHGWVAAAAATASPLRGLAVLGALWLGTLPALETGSVLLAKPLARARTRFPRALPILVLLLALAPALWRARGAFEKAGTAPHCHSLPSPK